jgi:TetR/AcrR family acrAB operon transcriptional repressor
MYIIHNKIYVKKDQSMRRTKEEAEITKQNLLKAALEVFSRKGYAATRVEDIAKQANVTTGAIYHHFGGKSDLYIALIEVYSARANQIFQQIIDEGGSPAAVLRRLLVRLFEYAEEDKEYIAVVELFLNTNDVSPELAIINQQVLESRRALVQFFTGLIQNGLDDGEFHPWVSPENTALALLGFINGMGLIWLQDPESFSIKERAEDLVDSFLSGIVIGG